MCLSLANGELLTLNRKHEIRPSSNSNQHGYRQENPQRPRQRDTEASGLGKFWGGRLGGHALSIPLAAVTMNPSHMRLPVVSESAAAHRFEALLPPPLDGGYNRAHERSDRCIPSVITPMLAVANHSHPRSSLETKSMNRSKAIAAVSTGAVFRGLLCGAAAYALGYEHLMAGVGLLSVCIFGLVGGFVVSKLSK